MNDKQPDAHSPEEARPDTSIVNENISAQDAEAYRQKIRSALPNYAEHLARDVDPPKTRAHMSDVITLISLCKQAFGSDEMLTSLEPQLLPLLKERLLPSLRRRERDTPARALANLSDHPLWHQEMVSLGYADEVSEPNKFREYDDFIKALKAIDDGFWSFQCRQFHEMSGRNFDFTFNFKEDAHCEMYNRLCERYKLLLSESGHYDD